MLDIRPRPLCDSRATEGLRLQNWNYYFYAYIRLFLGLPCSNEIAAKLHVFLSPSEPIYFGVF